jgi:hypothetical protein
VSDAQWNEHPPRTTTPPGNVHTFYGNGGIAGKAVTLTDSPVSENAAGYDGGIAQGMTREREEIYNLRDRSRLSRQQFHVRYLACTMQEAHLEMGMNEHSTRRRAAQRAVTAEQTFAGQMR